MSTSFLKPTRAAMLSVVLGLTGVFSSASADESADIAYRTVSVENVEIFYREAGDPKRPWLAPS